MLEEKFKQTLGEALNNWYEKLVGCELELSLTASFDQKFELKGRIENCKKEIKRLKLYIQSFNITPNEGNKIRSEINKFNPQFQSKIIIVDSAIKKIDSPTTREIDSEIKKIDSEISRVYQGIQKITNLITTYINRKQHPIYFSKYKIWKFLELVIVTGVGSFILGVVNLPQDQSSPKETIIGNPTQKPSSETGPFLEGIKTSDFSSLKPPFIEDPTKKDSSK